VEDLIGRHDMVKIWMDDELRHVRPQPRFHEHLRDPVRLAGTLYGLYDKDSHIDRIFGLLDDLETRQKPGASASAVHRLQ
jgi:hypothetical protein